MYFMKGSLTMDEAFSTTDDQRVIMIETVKEINKKQNKPR